VNRVEAVEGVAAGRAALMAEEAEVADHRQGGPDWFVLRLHAPRIAAAALPGQFAQVRVSLAPPPGAPGSIPAAPALDPLLRRPLSFCTLDPAAGTLSFIYRRVGRGTALLAGARPGDRISLLGPLGRPFPDPGRPAARGRPLVLAGGGLGIPPLAAGAAWACRAGRTPLAVLGAQSAAWLAGAAEVAATGAEVQPVTEDGSAGWTGQVTDALEPVLAERPGAEVWACGPGAMLARVAALCRARGAECWICVEGPVFAAAEVDVGDGGA
jgi:dihydroorotate dehydrogenase electron transfer subunit